ncbi:MAG: type II toxin-antitoxin system RelE/ParE family toxin [Blastocatellia bacterium]
MRIIKRPLARFDLIEEADFIEQVYGLVKAESFLDAAEAAFSSLVSMPLMGSPRPDLAAEISDLRQWRIKGFEDYLIFYRPLPDGVEIIRVLHGKRNIPTILSDEEAQE